MAQPMRLRVFRALVVAGNEGLTPGALGEQLDVPPATLSFHLRGLQHSGLVTQERSGRISRCRLDAGPIFAAAVWLNRYSKYWQAQFDFLAVALDDIETGRSANRPRAVWKHA